MDSDLPSSEPESEIERLQRLRQLSANLHRLKELRSANGLAFYRPHRKQDKFHAAGKKKRRFVRTGNRWGKSTAGAAEDIAWCMGERIWYPKGDPRRTAGLPERSVKGLLICSDWDKSSEIFTSQEDGEARGKIFKLLPNAAFVDVEKNQSGFICKIIIKSKWGGCSTLYIDTVKSYKSNPMGHESSDWDFIHVDEPIPKAMWEANSRGLMDRDGSAWFCCTPITELWINDYFMPSHRSREEFTEGMDFPGEKFEDKWVITGSSYDNTTLNPDVIRRYAADLSEADKYARILGHPKQLSGVIYPDFERDVHMYDKAPVGWADPCRPPPSWTIRYAIDPHPKTPHAVLFCATGPSGHTYFFAEIFQKCFTSDLAKMIQDTLGTGTQEELVPFKTLCDVIAWNENPVDGTTYAQDFYKHGLYSLEKAPKDPTRGILHVGELLRKRDGHGNPMVFFHESLRETLREFDRYVWDPKKEKPVDEDDHMMENLYRLAISGLDYVDLQEKPVIIKPLSLDHFRMNSISDPTREPTPRQRRRRELAMRC